MKATIHQSYFIPWLGYFSKLAFSDVFVVLDDVMFRKRHFFDRVQYVNMHGEIKWLSLPVGQNFRRPCREVKVNQPDKNYVETIIKTIEFSYAKSKHFSLEWDGLKIALLDPLIKFSGLIEINVSIIINIMKLLGIQMPLVCFSSELLENCDDPTERIFQICNKLNVDSVIVGNGMSLMIHEWPRLSNCGIHLEMQDYFKIHPVYEQYRRKRAGFQKGLTVVDAILNIGRETTRGFIIDQKYRPRNYDLKNQ